MPQSMKIGIFFQDSLRIKRNQKENDDRNISYYPSTPNSGSILRSRKIDHPTWKRFRHSELSAFLFSLENDKNRLHNNGSCSAKIVFLFEPRLPSDFLIRWICFRSNFLCILR